MVIAVASAVLFSPSSHADDAAAGKTSHTDEGFVAIFDEDAIDASRIKSGFANYRVDDGVIVGTTAEGSPNSFYVSDREYGDFELQFEVKVDQGLNSGVQIRSKLKNADRPNAHGGRLFGPQVEIESGPGQSGYIYGEATGMGWLSPEPQSDDKSVNTHDHFQNDQWNHYRVVARGPRIQTFINGEPIADLTHDKIYQSHPSGLIGLQVHGIKKGSGPYKVSWRNIKLKDLSN